MLSMEEEETDWSEGGEVVLSLVRAKM